MSTPRLALPYPGAGDPAAVPADMQELAQALDGAALAGQGAMGTRPAPSTYGRLYLEIGDGITPNVIYWDTGTQWVPVAPGAIVNTYANRPPAGTPGRLLWAYDQTTLYVDDGQNWQPTNQGASPIAPPLPAAPTEGQECNLLVDEPGSVVWHMKYRGGASSANKWEFLGGPPIIQGPKGAVSTPAGTWVPISGGPWIVAPPSGDYEVTIGAYCRLDGGTPGDLIIALSHDNLTPVGHSAIYTANAPGQGGYITVTFAFTMPGGAPLAMIADSVTGPGTFSEAWYSLRPIRLAP